MNPKYPKSFLLKQLNQALKHKSFKAILVSETQKEQLIQFLALLYKWNKAYNLTSLKDPSDMLVRHIFDSIAVNPFIKGQSIIDVGTGPGLPGLPLAILNPDKEFYLLDSLGKRITFIRQAVHQLGLKNVKPIQERVENFQKEGGFDIVLSRAFASLADMLSWCHHLLSEQGYFVALKGLLTEEEKAGVQPPFSIKNSYLIDVPELDAVRHVVEITKI